MLKNLAEKHLGEKGEKLTRSLIKTQARPRNSCVPYLMTCQGKCWQYAAQDAYFEYVVFCHFFTKKKKKFMQSGYDFLLCHKYSIIV